MAKLPCKHLDKENGWCKLHSDWSQPMAEICYCDGECECEHYKPIEEPSEKVEKNFQEFWKDIVCNDDGTLNPIAVKNELSDYSFILDQVPKVYSEITDGRLSYPHYEAETVLQIFRDEFANKVWVLKCLEDDWDDVTADCVTNEDYKRALFEYLEIEGDEDVVFH